MSFNGKDWGGGGAIILLGRGYTGVGGCFLEIISDYLSNRKQFVRADNFSSETLEIISGVPQGSLVGPFYFCIFINDLPEVLKFSDPYIFADDLKLLAVNVDTKDTHQDLKSSTQRVLSLPGSSYEYLNKLLLKFFDKIDGANIENNTKDARETIETTALDPDKTISSLDVKRLYTNLPLKEAIEIALQKLYSQESPPEIQRAAAFEYGGQQSIFQV